MNCLVVFYSYTGNTQKVAHLLQETLLQKNYQVKLTQLHALDESNTFVVQAYRALFGKKAQVFPVDTDLSQYGLVCIGTPVWAAKPAPAVNTFLSRCRDISKEQRFLIFYTYGSGFGIHNCVKHISTILRKKGAVKIRAIGIQQRKVKNLESVRKALEEELTHFFSNKLT